MYSLNNPRAVSMSSIERAGAMRIAAGGGMDRTSRRFIGSRAVMITVEFYPAIIARSSRPRSLPAPIKTSHAKSMSCCA